MKIEEAVTVFAALAQETRLKIFLILVENSLKGICPCEIAEKLKIPRNTLSFHLSLLTQAKLCTFKKEGKKLIYRPNCKETKKVMEFLHKNCLACKTNECEKCTECE